MANFLFIYKLYLLSNRSGRRLDRLRRHILLQLDMFSTIVARISMSKCLRWTRESMQTSRKSSPVPRGAPSSGTDGRIGTSVSRTLDKIGAYGCGTNPNGVKRYLLIFVLCWSRLDRFPAPMISTKIKYNRIGREKHVKFRFERFSFIGPIRNEAMCTSLNIH